MFFYKYTLIYNLQTHLVEDGNVVYKYFWSQIPTNVEL